MTGTHPRLEIRNIVRDYDGKRVVDDVSLAIQPEVSTSGCNVAVTEVLPL